MRYEWDESKRARNLLKHGLDFVNAWRVFEDPLRFDAPSPRRGEPDRRRVTALTSEEGDLLVLVYVTRRDAVRCISFRRSSEFEQQEYDAWLRPDHQSHE